MFEWFRESMLSPSRFHFNHEIILRIIHIETPFSIDNSIGKNSFIHNLMLSDVLFYEIDLSRLRSSIDLPINFKLPNLVTSSSSDASILLNFHMLEFHWVLSSILYVIASPSDFHLWYLIIMTGKLKVVYQL